MQKIIDIRDGVPGNPEYRMAAPVSLSIYDGEQIAVVGDNASGKTRLVDIISGSIPVTSDAITYDFTPSRMKFASENIKCLAFKDTYGTADGNYYLQQRWNQQDIDEETPTVGYTLDKALETASCSARRFNSGSPDRELEMARLDAERLELKERLCGLFKLDALADKYIISLSSGELRKFQLAKALLSLPRVLILDNPFIGLDASTRTQLSEILGDLIRNMKLLIIIVLPRLDIVPDFITHVIPVEGLKAGEKIPVGEYLAANPPASFTLRRENGRNKASSAGREIVRCNKVSIRYGDRTILRELDWTVRVGERWALGGDNGSGKSTLLSLVCADNPQSYACDIELFGRKRGSGESIWEIKQHIGYVSPEMHRAYQKNIPAADVVASGLFGTVGLFNHPTPQQSLICLKWMEKFGIADIAGKSFLKISSGEQRLCLLARAFVKDPDLLILDEPFHGLDEKNSELGRRIIDEFASSPEKTVIMVSHYPSELPSCITNHLYLKRNR